MNLRQFLLILRARWWVVLFILAATVATTVAVSLWLPKQYTAETAVVIDVKSPDPIMGAVLPGLISPSYMATQVDIIQSDKVAYQVIRALKLDENATARAQWQEDTEGRGSIQAWLATLLKKKLDVKPSRESNVITIAYTGTEPRFAQVVADAFAKAYIETSIDLRAEPAKQYATWFDQRNKQLREDLEAAQNRLSAFQRAKGIVAVDDALDIENRRLAELSTQLAMAQGQRADAGSRQSQAGSSAETLPEVLQNPVVANLKAALAQEEAKLDELGTRLGQNHPQYQSQKNQVAALRAKVATESQRVASSLGTAERVSQQRVSEIRRSLDTQQQRVLQLKDQRDQIAVLQRDVQNAQRAFDLVSQRLTQTSLESQVSQTNIVLLNPATEPIEPSSPKLLLNTLISIFLGTLLGVGAALLVELMDRRVRASDDLVLMLDLPLLGTLDSRDARRPSRRDLLPAPRRITA